jgi:hypothetical protein
VGKQKRDPTTKYRGSLANSVSITRTVNREQLLCPDD